MELAKRFISEQGQMAVELAVVMPVLIALVIISVDSMVYLGDCARFDRISGEIVRIHAASPAVSGEGASSCAEAIQADIEDAMNPSMHLSFSVTCVEKSESNNGSATGPADIVGSFSPRLQEYRCTLNYIPWPFTMGVFGFDLAPLSHNRTYIIDPYRPGVFL
ncbi:MAG: hypothetical protein HGA54_04990 [Actinobacteria bacterium]|nr:hypothetical protein [Actinomycetota bacterium]